MITKIPRVLFMADTRVALTRDLLLGIAKYIRQHRAWFIERNIYDYYLRSQIKISQIKKLELDGILCLNLPARQERFVEELIEAGFPVLLKSLGAPMPGAINIISNNRMISQIAAEHLLNLGLRHFAFCGFSALAWSRERQQAFTEAISAGGHKANIYRPKQRAKKQPLSLDVNDLSSWLAELPKPVGIMACNDDCGLYLLECCHLMDIKVPNEVAVIGVDNEEYICKLCHPSLSSIARDPQTAGYEGARLLDFRMRGEAIDTGIVEIQSLYVVRRESTDILAVSDPLLASAIRLIRLNAARPLSAEEVAEKLMVSRRSLDQKFTHYLGRTVYEEITRVRIERIAETLRESNLSITQVAYEYGFNGADHLCNFFTRHQGMSPGEYRRKYI
ncbi:MAG: substrate-binding domain-containing protein [Sedimentisphaerales bacterium]|nr:substrate-binding domain-containing protein [Sedimentisphaerales bacterium]